MTEKSSNRRETTTRRKSSAPLTSEETELIKRIRENPSFAEKLENFISNNQIEDEAD